MELIEKKIRRTHELCSILGSKGRLKIIFYLLGQKERSSLITSIFEGVGLNYSSTQEHIELLKKSAILEELQLGRIRLIRLVDSKVTNILKSISEVWPQPEEMDNYESLSRTLGSFKRWQVLLYLCISEGEYSLIGDIGKRFKIKYTTSSKYVEDFAKIGLVLDEKKGKYRFVKLKRRELANPVLRLFDIDLSDCKVG